MAHLLLKNVNKIYPNGCHAVHDLNLEINGGEFICIVGESGCGKSTVLRLIAGQEDITSGEFYINGKLSNRVSPRDRGIATGFQSYALYPHLTVYENLAFGLNLEGIDEDVIEKKVHETAKILGLTDCLEKFPRSLSDGQCLRAAVGRALIRNVKVILMDEPLSNLDSIKRATARSEIKSIHRSSGVITIYTTDDIAEAAALADRIVVMKSGGYVKQTGAPSELYYYPKNLFVAAATGEFSMNFIQGAVEGGKFKACGLEFQLENIVKNSVGAEGKKAVLAFRPEAIKLKTEEECFAVKCKAEFSELLGDVTKVHATAGADVEKFKIILIVDSREAPQDGSEFTFKIPRKAVYLFDAETEEAMESEAVRQ